MEKCKICGRIGCSDSHDSEPYKGENPQQDSDGLSGPWVGYYTYKVNQSKHRMELGLTFKEKQIRGDGLDDIGRFVIFGHYDLGKKECYWTKTYIGKHSVYYKGFIDGGRIWGFWVIGGWQGGGFLIWQKGLGELNADATEKENPIEDVADADANKMMSRLPK